MHQHNTTGLYVGLMSGTSLDGVDAALVEIGEGSFRLIHTVFQAFDADLRRELLALNQTGHNELQRAATAGNALALRYAGAVQLLLDEATDSTTAISAIGCHGQTVRHRPDLGFALQIGNAALLAELSGITVIADFRNRDIAAGGQGAPLVPAFHAAAFQTEHHNRAIVNIGGISNLTWLPAKGDVTGFDCGPGNLLLDGWAQQHLGTPFDRDGTWASSGRVIPELLGKMQEDAFFSIAPPKSTGRDMFNMEWLHAFLYEHYTPADVQATLLELSSLSIADAIRRYCKGADEIYLCGGGAHNSAMMKGLKKKLEPLPLMLTDELGIGGDWVEATAFAWLAFRTLQKQPGNLPGVTGAKGFRILGAIYPA